MKLQSISNLHCVGWELPVSRHMAFAGGTETYGFIIYIKPYELLSLARERERGENINLSSVFTYHGHLVTSPIRVRTALSYQRLEILHRIRLIPGRTHRSQQRVA